MRGEEHSAILSFPHFPFLLFDALSERHGTFRPQSSMRKKGRKEKAYNSVVFVTPPLCSSTFEVVVVNSRIR